jgi:uncharacterized membrane protein
MNRVKGAIMERLKSRKFWITVVAGILFGVLKVSGVGIPDEIVKLIVVYVAGQSAVDIAAAVAAAKKG